MNVKVKKMNIWTYIKLMLVVASEIKVRATWSMWSRETSPISGTWF